MQRNKKGNWIPTKVFPCDCGSEGITVTVEEDKDFFECTGAPFINLAFWEFAHKLDNRVGMSRWERIKLAFNILRGKSLWTDMVCMRSSTAKNLAYHILYLINKGNKSDSSIKPLVDWPKNDIIY